MDIPGQSIKSLRESMNAMAGTIDSLKMAVAEQERIVDDYNKLIRDIESGARIAKEYTIPGLQNGIEQAKAHIAKLGEVRSRERDRIKETQQMINDIEEAARIKSEMIVVNVDEYDFPIDHGDVELKV